MSLVCPGCSTSFVEREDGWGVYADSQPPFMEAVSPNLHRIQVFPVFSTSVYTPCSISPCWNNSSRIYLMGLQSGWGLWTLSSVWIELEDSDYSLLSHLDPFYIGAHSVVSWEQNLLNCSPKWGHPRSKSNSFLRDTEVFGNQYRSGEGEKGKQRLSALLENQFWTKMCKVYRASGSIFHFWGQHSLMCGREKLYRLPLTDPEKKERREGRLPQKGGVGWPLPSPSPCQAPTPVHHSSPAGTPPGQRQHGKGCQVTPENDRDAHGWRWTPLLRLPQIHKAHQEVLITVWGSHGHIIRFQGRLKGFFSIFWWVSPRSNRTSH